MPVGKVVSDNRAMAICGISLQTEQANVSVRATLQDLQQQTIMLSQRLAKKSAQNATVFLLSVLLSDVRRNSELGKVNIANASLGQSIFQRGFGEILFAAPRAMSNVKDGGDSSLSQQIQELFFRPAFIADGEDAGMRHGRCVDFIRCLWVHTPQRAVPKLSLSSIAGRLCGPRKASDNSHGKVRSRE